jgi:hypothetical protein
VIGTKVHGERKAAANQRQPLRQILGDMTQQKIVASRIGSKPVPARRQQLPIEDDVPCAQREPRDCSSVPIPKFA